MKKLIRIFGVISMLTMVSLLTISGKCFVNGGPGINNGVCFGDVVHSCLPSMHTPNCIIIVHEEEQSDF